MELKPLFNEIVDAIHEKDGLSDGIAAADFPQRIRELPSGGFLQGPLDPLETYKAVRPADWLPMPQPEDDEIYLLVMIPDGGSALLAFTATCTGSYTVKLGTVQDGVFVSGSSFSRSSGSTFETTLSSDSFGNLTSGGMRQAMVKISGTDIRTWVPSGHTSRSTFGCWNIVDIRCRLPKGTQVAVSNKSNLNYTLIQLRYFSWEGPNQLTDASYMFYSCYALEAVLALDTSKATNMAYMFASAYGLLAIPDLDTSLVTNMAYMFYSTDVLHTIPRFNTSRVTNMAYMFGSSRGLLYIPEIDMSSVTDMSYMFNSCHSLIYVPDLDTKKVVNMTRVFGYNTELASAPALDYSSVTNLSELFYACMSLKYVPAMNISKATNMTDTFASTFNIGSVTFNPEVTGWSGCDISLVHNTMDHDALVSLLESLPTISSRHKLTLTGNFGASSLTDDEKAIATAKNWTLTI